MSHYFDSGYSVRKPTWHGLATILEEYPDNWNDARTAAGLDWDAEMDDMFSHRLTDDEMLAGVQRILENTPSDERAQAIADMYKSSQIKVEGWHRIYRNDTFETLGTTKLRYVPIGHADFGEIFEAVLKQTNIKFETAGSVENGACVWALAYLDEPITLPGDNTPTLQYLLLTARHDGEGGVRLQATSVRVVCANTVRMAEAEADANGAVFTFRHTGNWRDRLDEATQAIQGVHADFDSYQEFAKAMLDIAVTEGQRELYLEKFVPMPEALVLTDRQIRNVETARQTVRNILNSDTCTTINGTAFGLVQASAEYLDFYRRSRDEESAFRRQLMRPSVLKTKAIELVKEVVTT